MGAINWKQHTRVLLGVAGITFAVYTLLPQIRELPDAVEQVAEGTWWWVLAAAAASVVSYVGSAISLQGSIGPRLPFGELLRVQVASSFTGLLAPQGLGAAGLVVRYLTKRGLPAAAAATSAGVNTVAGLLVHVLGIVAAVTIVGFGSFTDFRIPPRLDLELIAVGIAVAIGLVVWSPFGRRSVVPRILEAGRALRSIFSQPLRGVQLLGGSALITLAYGYALAFSLNSFGRLQPVVTVFAVYLVASALGSLAPTPGGLGAIEAAMVAGLTSVGTAAGTAVGGVLLFRLLTFWLPIAPGIVAFRQLTRDELV